MIRALLAVLLACGAAQAQPSLQAEGAIRWQLDAPWFGGWSGIEIGDGGTRMTVISDRGHLLEAQLRRSGGRIDSIAVVRSRPMARAAGGHLRGPESDAEGLAIAQGGRAFVSFEHRHRIMALDLATGLLRGRISLPFEADLGRNAGVEALAIGHDGTLYALGEQAPAQGAPFPLHAYRDGQWRVAAHIPKRGGFLPVGADIDAKGRLWLLERTVGAFGFRSRVRLFVLGPGKLREYELLTTAPLHYDNLEGISVWQDAAGQMRLTMISDDNFLRLQRTQIVEYRVLE